jgi:hypothetical protein
MKSDTVIEGASLKLFVSKSRLYLLLCVLAYSLSIAFGHEHYLSVEQSFWGFEKVNYDLLTTVVIALLIVAPSTVLPLKFNRPSSIFLYSLMFFVYVPGVVIAMLNHDDSLARYFWLFFSFCLGMVFCCVIVRATGRDSSAEKEPSRFLVMVNLTGSIVCFLLLFDTYKDVLSFSGLNEIYAQREKGAATSLFIGYCQVYLAYVFSPMLFVYGILYRRVFCFALSVCFFIFVYMITAERTILLLPVALLGIFTVFKWRGFGISNAYYLFLGGAFLIVMISLFFDYSSFVNGLGVYFFTRIIAIPGLFVSQYYDLFSVQGYTHWSHVSVLGLLVDIPAAYATDDKWPALGKILAERILGIQSQSNASFVATDGVAALGSIGVAVVFLLFGFWLMVLDKVAKGWNKLFVLPIVFPLAFVSTNASLFTMLTSFGGVFWIVMFLVDRFRIPIYSHKELVR